jgi:Ferritin-like domain
MRKQHKGDASGETLRSSEFFVFRRGRRAFMSQLLASGGRAALATSTAAAVFGLGSGRVRAAAASDGDIVNFGNAAVGAERVGIAFYSNALGVPSPFANQPTDLAKGTLLNSAHRVYFEAALNQETQHLKTLLSLKLSFPFSKFGFPAGTFDSAPAMLAFGERLESVFIGAYLGAVRVSASVADSLGVAVAELAAQIVGVECEHRVLIRDIAGLNPPNDRFFEGDQTPGPGTQVGNTGARSTVYSSGDAAVADLVALGIVPIP